MTPIKKQKTLYNKKNKKTKTGAFSNFHMLKRLQRKASEHPSAGIDTDPTNFLVPFVTSQDWFPGQFSTVSVYTRNNKRINNQWTCWHDGLLFSPFFLFEFKMKVFCAALANIASLTSPENQHGESKSQ